MPSIATLKAVIRRTKHQIAKQQNKQVYAKELHDKIAAKDEIERLESKLLRLEQQVIFELAMIGR